MKRKIDKTKKSNIKCEHCKHFDCPIDEHSFCMLKEENKNYWNRCKDFEWSKDFDYKEEEK